MTTIITDHLVDGKSNPLTIIAEGEPDNANAHKRYTIKGFNSAGNPYTTEYNTQLTLVFQSGSDSDTGPNGITLESLLGICKHMLLDGYQKGPMACEENQLAGEYIHNALEMLKNRTRRRIEQQVIGSPLPHDSRTSN